ncbi:hypothetical protein ACWEGS_28955 [Streptomyces sp. NPDC004822]
MWGKTAVGVALAMAALSGCGGDGGAESKPKAAASAPSVQKATTAFQDALSATGDCEVEPGTCWEQMTAVIKPARKLREAMRADKTVSAEFWSPAYAIIDKMEDGYAVGEDQGGGADNMTTNRIAVFGGAHDLSDWLDEHPVS